jgi:DHA1 family multidrug resistance protein-like MFS transporter
MAYISDSTPGEKRGGGMGLLGAAGGVGTIVGPALGGLLGGGSLAIPFFVAAGLSLLSLLLAALFLPESLSSEKRRESRAKDKIVDLRLWGRAVFGPLGVLFLLILISTAGLMIFANVFGLYALARFNYGTEQVGVILMVLGLVSALAQGVLVGPLTKRWGDLLVIRASLLATAIGLILMLLARDFVATLLTTAFFGLATAIQIPALTSWTSRRATIAQGIAMGLSNAFISLGRIVGPLIGGMTFDVNINLPYLSAAGVMFLGFIVSLVWLSTGPQRDREPPAIPAS